MKSAVGLLLRVSDVRNIGLAVKSMRLRAGMTQEELASRINIHQPRLSKIENGRDARVDIVVLLALVKACNQPLLLTPTAFGAECE
jgi:transcriptional regulator with XRE-family HTH domain